MRTNVNFCPILRFSENCTEVWVKGEFCQGLLRPSNHQPTFPENTQQGQLAIHRSFQEFRCTHFVEATATIAMASLPLCGTFGGLTLNLSIKFKEKAAHIARRLRPRQVLWANRWPLRQTINSSWLIQLVVGRPRGFELSGFEEFSPLCTGKRFGDE